ncbi:hypothetical protein C8J57DRAFT_1307133 [Mycena rebaudengoi]|nr:hypothetical protein C8J57DRAFT_1307133 [Mycena rebaudengoi]
MPLTPKLGCSKTCPLLAAQHASAVVTATRSQYHHLSGCHSPQNSAVLKHAFYSPLNTPRPSSLQRVRDVVTSPDVIHPKTRLSQKYVSYPFLSRILRNNRRTGRVACPLLAAQHASAVIPATRSRRRHLSGCHSPPNSAFPKTCSMPSIQHTSPSSPKCVGNRLPRLRYYSFNELAIISHIGSNVRHE